MAALNNYKTCVCYNDDDSNHSPENFNSINMLQKKAIYKPCALYVNIM
jgi:hypothetical protein